MRQILAGINQSIWDIALQEYGDVTGVKQLMIDNPTVCDFEKSIPAGTTIYISGEPINKSWFDYFKSKKIQFATAVQELFVPSDWILATGIWNDNGFWRDNALWID